MEFLKCKACGSVGMVPMDVKLLEEGDEEAGDDRSEFVDHLTDPTKRPQWQRLVDEVLTMTEGRRGIGTINHCMHGPEVIVEHVADWRPFSYITLRYDVAGVEDWAWTYQLDHLEDGTRLTMRLSDPGSDAWARFGADFSASVDDQATQLAAVLDESLPTGTLD